MKVIIMISIWIISCIINYPLYKKYMAEDGSKWTQKDRALGIIMGLFAGPIAVFAVLLCFLINSDRYDKPVKW